MSIERAALRGKLAELKDQRLALELRCEGLCRGIRQELNILLTDVSGLNVPLAAQQMDDLVEAWGEIAGIEAQIARLEKELD